MNPNTPQYPRMAVPRPGAPKAAASPSAAPAVPRATLISGAISGAAAPAGLPGHSANPANNQAALTYLKAKVMTATPEQLQMMLFDGALRFGEQARIALQSKNYEQSYNAISRVQKILTEMSCSLKRDLHPELCGKLAALYNYAFRLLTEANCHHTIEALDEAMNVLRYQRETWALLLEQLGKQRAAAAAQHLDQNLDLPAPDARMEASFSFKG